MSGLTPTTDAPPPTAPTDVAATLALPSIFSSFALTPPSQPTQGFHAWAEIQWPSYGPGPARHPLPSVAFHTYSVRACTRVTNGHSCQGQYACHVAVYRCTCIYVSVYVHVYTRVHTYKCLHPGHQRAPRPLQPTGVNGGQGRVLHGCLPHPKP